MLSALHSNKVYLQENKINFYLADTEVIWLLKNVNRNPKILVLSAAANKISLNNHYIQE